MRHAVLRLLPPAEGVFALRGIGWVRIVLFAPAEYRSEPIARQVVALGVLGMAAGRLAQAWQSQGHAAPNSWQQAILPDFSIEAILE